MRLEAARPAELEDDIHSPGADAMLPRDEAIALVPLVRRYEELLRSELAAVLRPNTDARVVMNAIGDNIGPMLACDALDLAYSLGGAMPVEEMPVLVGRFAWGSARHMVHVYLPTTTKDPGAAVSVRPDCAPVCVCVTCCQCPSPDTPI